MTEHTDTEAPLRAHGMGLGPVLGQVQSELTRVMTAAFGAEHIALSYNQIRVLRRIGALGPTSVSALARALSYDSGGMTRLLDGLEHLALLQRQPDPSDRRALRIVLTPAGEELSGRLITISERVLARTLSELSEGERRRLADYMQRVLRTLRGMH
mgnify:CR=1 FL=1